MAKAIPMLKSIGFNYNFYGPLTNIAIYKTFIRSRGEYALCILPKPNLRLLQIVQNKAINAILSTNSRSTRAATHLLTRISKLQVRNDILKCKLLLR